MSRLKTSTIALFAWITTFIAIVVPHITAAHHSSYPSVHVLDVEHAMTDRNTEGTIQNAGSRRRETSADLRNRLYDQLLKDYPELRECLEQEQGGITAAKEEFTIEEHDLNRDGRAEFELQLSGKCSCGMVNCSIWVYRQDGSKFESILETAGLGLSFEKTFSKGYRDLSVEARESALTRSESYYKFDGKQYRETHTNIRDLESGKVKPAYRRVVFKRGASSATVQGNVTPALSDTYRVGARAGQTMTLELSAPQKEIHFFISGAKSSDLLADNARRWTGKLPESGEYSIVVMTIERGGRYSLTINIR